MRRAQLGAVLRGRPTALTRGRVVATAAAAPAAVRALAADLERAAPDLPLMVQLRARLFDAAVAAAPARGLRCLVSIAAGLDERRLAAGAFAPGRVWEVDHPAVLAAKEAPRPGLARWPADPLDGPGWVTRLLREAALTDATLFLVHNASFWATAPPLPGWLPELAAAAPVGSEVVLNLFDGEPGSLPTELATAGAPMRAGAAGLLALETQVRALGLEILAAFDSTDVQRACLDAEDLLVRELYLWLVRPPSSAVRRSRPPSWTALVGWRRAAAPRVRHAGPLRLRRDVVVRRRSPTTCLLVRAVTPLRHVGVTTDVRGAVIARLLDGTRRRADVVQALADDGCADPTDRVDATIAALWRAGFLIDARVARGPSAPRSLQALGRIALAALRRDDRPAACRAMGALEGRDCSRSTAYLRALVDQPSDAPALEITGRPPVHVVGRRGNGGAHRVVADARRLLARIAVLLRCRRLPGVLVDLSPARAARPLTYVAAAAPFTLVVIPESTYAPAVLAHELTHVLAYGRSRWLSEGLAVWVQRRLAPGPCFPDDVAEHPPPRMARSPTVPLATLLGDPACASVLLRPALVRPSRAAYRDAAAFVDFVVRTFGLGPFLRLFRACSHAAPDTAAERVCRSVGCGSLAELESQWRRTGA